MSELITEEEIVALAVRAMQFAESAVMPEPNGHRTIPWPAF